MQSLRLEKSDGKGEKAAPQAAPYNGLRCISGVEREVTALSSLSPKMRVGLIVIVVLLLAVLSRLIPMSDPHVEIKPEQLFPITETIPFTNSILLTIILDIFLIIMAVVVVRNLKMVPRGFQNVVEFAIDGLYKLFQGVNREYVGRAFPVVATIFFYLLFSNWAGLIPGVGSIGVCHEGGHGHEEEHALSGFTLRLASVGAVGETAAMPPAASEAEQAYNPCPQGHALVPLFRSPSADLNFTFALALLAFFYIEYMGIIAIGPAYFGKFINFHGFQKSVGMGIMEFLVGLLELISELARILAFSFRLFGNIFAGEVLLAVMAFLVPMVLPLPFYGFEIFVGIIQAFVFAMLTMAFVALAVTPHGDNHGSEEVSH